MHTITVDFGHDTFDLVEVVLSLPDDIVVEEYHRKGPAGGNPMMSLSSPNRESLVTFLRDIYGADMGEGDITAHFAEVA